MGYLQYFLENEIILKISTITIAEYCVRGTIDELPLKNMQIVPFNLDHAKKTGEFADIIFRANNLSTKKLSPRAIIPNDSKLFAQAHLDKTITHFITSDNRSKNTFAKLKKRATPNFEIISIEKPYTEIFGILDLQ